MSGATGPWGSKAWSAMLASATGATSITLQGSTGLMGGFGSGPMMIVNPIEININFTDEPDNRTADELEAEFAAAVKGAIGVDPPSSPAGAVGPAEFTQVEVSGCDHGISFDPVVAYGMSPADVRRRWPRLFGKCPKGCGYEGIAYASNLHFVAGDW